MEYGVPMNTFGDPVGRAILEADNPGVFRIAEVEYRFEVVGLTLEELGRRAWVTCKEFYGEQRFVLDSLSVVQVATDDGPVYAATGYAKLESRW